MAHTYTKDELEAAKKHGQNVFVPTELVVDDRVTEQLAANSFLAGIDYQKQQSYSKEDLRKAFWAAREFVSHEGVLFKDFEDYLNRK
jgi:hypothetical protein